MMSQPQTNQEHHSIRQAMVTTNTENTTTDECDRLIGGQENEDCEIDERNNKRVVYETKNNNQLMTKLFSFISSPRTKELSNKHQWPPSYVRPSSRLDDAQEPRILNYSDPDANDLEASVPTSSRYRSFKRSSPQHHHSRKHSTQSTCLTSRCCLTFVIFVTFAIISMKLFLLLKETESELINVVEDDELNTEEASRWLISSPKCHIPVIDAWHSSILDYVRIEPALNCSEIYLNSTLSNNRAYSITTVRNNLLYLANSIELKPNSDCCYRNVSRSIDGDDSIIIGETCIDIKENPMRINQEVIIVECSKFNYTNAHSFIIHNSEEELALKRIADEKLKKDDYYNIVMVGMDTMSRLNAHRQVSKTLELLQDKYKALEFLGYNKVGENTFPNLIPLLTGLTPEQLSQTQCWMTSNYTQEDEIGDDYLDNCKYLWSYYQQLGYITYFSEDYPKASTFNYLKPGFKSPPTNFYGRPFTIAQDDLLLPPLETIMGCAPCQLGQPVVEVDLANLESFISEHKDKPYFAFHWINCPQHDDLNGGSLVDDLMHNFLNNIAHLTRNNTFVIFFSDHGYRWNDFVSTRVGHYEASLPMLYVAPPKNFIEKHPYLYENLQLHRSTLITPFDMFKTILDIRDLGLKTKSLNQSSQMESATHKLVATTSAPKKIELEDYTTNPTATTVVKQIKMQDGRTYKQKFRILSMLNRNNSTQTDRSCIEAGIPDNYCVCHEFQVANLTAADVLGAAYYFVYVHLYEKIHQFGEKICHHLDLGSVENVETFDFKVMKLRIKDNSEAKRKRRRRASVLKAATTTIPTSPNSNKEQISDLGESQLPNREYNIRLSTKPGDALFQEVIRFHGDSEEECILEANKVQRIIEDSSVDHDVKHLSVLEMNKICKFSIHSDSISRLNLYRDQSKCVKSNIELKKICYCKDLINR